MKLTLETARKMYASNDESIKAFALDNYSKEELTKEELTKEELPKTWRELKEIKGYYVDGNSRVRYANTYTDDKLKNVFPREEEAEACIALTQLCQLRDRYNGDWRADWRDDSQKHTIGFVCNSISLVSFNRMQQVLNFKTAELRDKFLENFRELIEIARPLL